MFNFNRLKREHKHKWDEEKYLNRDHSMIWTVRRCVECDVVEIFMGGGTGDKTWRPFNGEFKFEWEKEWFEAAERVWEDNSWV